MITRGMSPEQAKRIRDAQARAWAARAARDVWNERYRLAIATGFGDSDARLHADQELDRHARDKGGE